MHLIKKALTMVSVFAPDLPPYRALCRDSLHFMPQVVRGAGSKKTS